MRISSKSLSVWSTRTAISSRLCPLTSIVCRQIEPVNTLGKAGAIKITPARHRSAGSQTTQGDGSQPQQEQNPQARFKAGNRTAVGCSGGGIGAVDNGGRGRQSQPG